MEQQADRAPRAARWAPAVAVLAVLAVIGAVTALLGGRSGEEAGTPPLLRLSSAAADSSSASGSTGEFFVASSTMLAGSYRLEGQLPTGGPERGRVHRLTGGQVDEGVVRRLATALGISAEPQRADGRWTVLAADGSATLEVADEPGNPWWYGPVPQGEPMPVEPVPGTETGGSAPGCPAPQGDPAVAEPCASVPVPLDPPPPAEVAPVDEAAALAAARPVLEAVGLAGADLRTQAYGAVRAVMASRPVDGLPTQGMDTRVEVDTDGRLLWVNGMLGGTTTGDEYPLVSAQEAFDLLADAPHHDIASLCAPDVPCGPTEQVVTGARPGLQLHLDADGPLLVPAWLFTVRDAPEPVGQIAVDPKHLWTPDVPEAPVVPPVADPGAPAERTTFGFDRVARGVQENEVIVGYGDSGSCPHRNVIPLVQETDDAVTIRLEADAYPPHTPCTADYLGVDLTVPLERPLGDRVVVDGTSGTQHPLP